MANGSSSSLANGSSSNLSNNLINEHQYKYPLAPEILDINDEEKFRDSNGALLNITIRGKRNSKECYFRVKDISKEFDMPRLQYILLDQNTTYIINKHYYYFTIILKDIVSIDDSKNEVYLTYLG